MAILKIKTYPIKGMQGMDNQCIDVQPNLPLTGDRRFAIAPIEIPDGQWVKKSQLIHSGNHPVLVFLRAVYDEKSVVILLNEKEILRFTDDFQKINHFLSDYLQKPVHILHQAMAFADNPDPFISVQNKASFDKMIQDSGFQIDDYRLRDNLLIDGLPAFAEQHWQREQKIVIHGKNATITCRFIEENGRCKTTNINLQTAKEDINLPQFLMKQYHHTNLCFFMIAEHSGTIALGDEVLMIS